jgi:hypothetical protein
VLTAQNSSNCFYAFFLHHLIERDLLIQKNTSFSKCAKFSTLFFFQLLKIIFSDTASNTEYKQVVKSTRDGTGNGKWPIRSGTGLEFLTGTGREF